METIGDAFMVASGLNYTVSLPLSLTDTLVSACKDMHSQLWKVETIGDAFMVASGLDVSVNDDSLRSDTYETSSGTHSLTR